MKKTLLFLLTLTFCGSSFGQFVAVMEVKEPIEGVCDQDKVYALFPSFTGQVQAKCPVTKDQILEQLNAQVEFLKDKPKYKDKGMINIIINCNGEMVRSKISNKTKSPELDQQIEAVFATLGEWQSGKLDGEEVDSSRLYSFKIKKGVFVWD